MQNRQKIVYGLVHVRGPSDINLCIFVCSFNSWPRFMSSPLLTMGSTTVIEENGKPESRQTSKEQTKRPIFKLEGP